MGHLVGDKAYEDRPALLTIADKVTHRLLDGDVDVTHTLSDISHKSVHRGVFKRMVKLCALTYLRVDPKLQGTDPLPVAVVAKIDSAVLAALT